MKRFREGSNINKELSVVIPTVGEPTLREVIIALNKGSLVPKEIIVCFSLHIVFLLIKNKPILFWSFH